LDLITLYVIQGTIQRIFMQRLVRFVKYTQDNVCTLYIRSFFQY